MLNKILALSVAASALALSGCVATTQPSTNASKESQQREDLACGEWSKGPNHKLTGPNCEWVARCNYDEFQDSTSCQVEGPGLSYDGILISLYKSGNIYIHGSYRHHPGRLTTVRIDDNDPITAADSTKGYFGEQQNQEVIDQMTAGDTLRFSGVEWPSKYIRKVQPLDGFAEAYNFAQSWLAERSNSDMK